MKKKDIIEYMNEVVVKASPEDVGKVTKEVPDDTTVVVDSSLEEGKDPHEGKSCKEAHPNMSHSAWKKNMEESDTLDLNLLEKEIYEDIKNEEYGKMSKKDIMEMISFSKVNEVIEEEEEVVAEDGVETKPKVKPKTAPTKTPRRNSPFNPPKKDPAPAKGEYEGLSPEEEKEIEDAIGVLDEGSLTESIITITKSFLNV
jgi:hypothetical protein